MFKPGDKVKRINYNWLGVNVGDVHTVNYQSNSEQLYLIGRGNAFTPKCFKLIEAATTPRKHAEVIKAWADGAPVQALYENGLWIDAPHPGWSDKDQYRVKPTPKPDVVLKRFLNCGGHLFEPSGKIPANVQFTLDGETGKLKHVEII